MNPQTIKASIFSRGIKKIAHLHAFLPEYELVNKQDAQAIIGWAYRPSAQRARAFAAEKHLPYIALEDGWLRSLGLGVQGDAPLSMVLDDVGIYYGTSKSSRLEQLILAADALSDAEQASAENAMNLIRQHRLSKYNHAPDFEAQTYDLNRPLVLVLDQTFGDMAIEYGQANADTFRQMLQTAIADNPDAEIWVKTHPDVLCGKKQGYLTQLAQSEKVKLLAEDVNPISLLEQADKVYCVNSHMGFEALLCQKEVHVFGAAWYAGWGLTHDYHAWIAELKTQTTRRQPRSLTQLFHAAYLQYSRYLNPNTGEAGTIFDVIEHLAMRRRHNELLRGHIYCIGMSLWKKAVAKPFLNTPACRLHFVSSLAKIQPERLPANSRLLAWGNGKQEILDFAQQHGLSVLRMEDGFVRSVGLGSNLVAPASLVIDDLGIYFNPQTASRLENILQNIHFSPQDKQQAEHIQQLLIAHQVSKYNVGTANLNLPTQRGKTILVPGQVEDDASIRHGSPKIYRNLDLLQTVRAANPDAYIIYKPHPDVVSGNRVGNIPLQTAQQFADHIAEEADIISCINQADEVHTMTSLSGFEALLRGKKVHCYGLPFYAGWGLTHDFLPLDRRNRKLELWQLIAGTLLYYPSYINPQTKQAINAQTAIMMIRQNKLLQKNHKNVKQRWLNKQISKLKQIYLSLR
ncbi:MAG: capsular polysaccharide biosynthesis protein [Neisseria sp.]|nr:capsular polysaccharide biosynthesis protein [Neisseria sp.]